MNKNEQNTNLVENTTTVVLKGWSIRCNDGEDREYPGSSICPVLFMTKEKAKQWLFSTEPGVVTVSTNKDLDQYATVENPKILPIYIEDQETLVISEWDNWEYSGYYNEETKGGRNFYERDYYTIVPHEIEIDKEFINHK